MISILMIINNKIKEKANKIKKNNMKVENMIIMIKNIMGI
jgi:hypothetical protein